VDVGQGDAVLLLSPSGKAYLYDLGNRERELAAALAGSGVDTLEAVLVSHPDLDHFGAYGALRDVAVKRWYLPEVVRPDPAWESFVGALDASGADPGTLSAGDTLLWADGTEIEALWPPRHFPGSDNDRSLVLRVTYAGSRVLLTGDAEGEAESGLLRSGRSLSAHLLKVGHHGSRTSSGLPFLAAVSARWAVISCDSAVYGHPHGETLAGLSRLIGPERVLRTDREGTIAFELDAAGARRWKVESRIGNRETE
jgi:competence protein ComEC